MRRSSIGTSIWLTNTGTYDLEGSTRTVDPQFAKTPHYVGGTGTYEFDLSGDTLTLTWKMVTSPDGVKMPFFAQGRRANFTLARVK